MLLLPIVLLAGGCDPTSSSRGQGVIEAQDPARNLAQAKACNEEALKLIEHGDLTAAERQLKAALKADPLYGPAHNSLGIVYYRRNDYYQAACEFQSAASIMSRKAEPRNNLGLVMEAAGRLEDAARSYEGALSVEPSAVEVMANLARVRIRMNRNDERTRQLLEDIILKDTRSQWVSWARQRLITMCSTRQASSAPAED